MGVTTSYGLFFFFFFLKRLIPLQMAKANCRAILCAYFCKTKQTKILSPYLRWEKGRLPNLGIRGSCHLATFLFIRNPIIGRMRTPVREAFSYGIRHIHCDSMKHKVILHWITMNMPYAVPYPVWKCLPYGSTHPPLYVCYVRIRV